MARALIEHRRPQLWPHPVVLNFHHPIPMNLSAEYNRQADEFFKDGYTYSTVATAVTAAMLASIASGWPLTGLLIGFVACSWWGASALSLYHGFRFQRLALCDRIAPAVRADHGRGQRARG